MSRNTSYAIKTLGGASTCVTGAIINGIWGIDKREDNYFYLTHIPTGLLITSAKTQRVLKELVNSPDMIDETDLFKIADAVIKFWNVRGWKG